MVTQVSDVDNMNITQLMYLQHQLNSNNQVVLPSAVNHTAATISTDNQDIIRALTDKIEKLAADLEKTKINGNNNQQYFNNKTSAGPSSNSNQAKNDYTCRNCGENGHVQCYCKQPCKSCGDTSHTIGGCRNNNNSNGRQDFLNGRRL